MPIRSEQGRSLNHVSYVVDELYTAARYWTATFGVGPFFVLEHIKFDSIVTPDMDEAVFDHSFAFGQWGAVAVELQQVHEVQPPRLASRLSDRAFSHIAYTCDDPGQESERLERAGMPMFMRVRVDAADVEATFHDAPRLGHAIELHKRSAALENVHRALAGAAAKWDGSDPIRPWPPSLD
jgi:hypothetical protein